MTKDAGENDAMERRLVRALEAAPVVTIPEDFALQVAAKAPGGAMAVHRAGSMRSSVGTRVAWAGAAVLLVAIFVLAPSSAGTGMRHWLEYALELDFVALTAWLSLRPLLRSR